jgi:methionine salvage enolase-phosphatase E1
MVKDGHKDSVNDRMIKWTALPAVYLWLAASGAVVAMGILKPEVVLTNIEGFIALIAIIGGTAQPAFATMLELWKQEQQTETELHPAVIESQTKVMEARAELDRELARKAQEHMHMMDAEERRAKIELVKDGKAVFKKSDE